jgi:hypothetical protein
VKLSALTIGTEVNALQKVISRGPEISSFAGGFEAIQSPADDFLNYIALPPFSILNIFRHRSKLLAENGTI